MCGDESGRVNVHTSRLGHSRRRGCIKMAIAATAERSQSRPSNDLKRRSARQRGMPAAEQRRLVARWLLDGPRTAALS
jgi:hypothetical protein